MRVFLDTNVLASAVATRGLCADVLRSVIEFHDLVISDLLLEELSRILRAKFHASEILIAETIRMLQQDADLAGFSPLTQLPLKDPADIRIVSAAINGEADCLVTGDKEILELETAGRVEIVSPRQFWERLKEQS